MTGSWALPAVAGSRRSCAEPIRAAMATLRTIPPQQDWPQAIDASRAALVALELVERQPTP